MWHRFSQINLYKLLSAKKIFMLHTNGGHASVLAKWVPLFFSTNNNNKKNKNSKHKGKKRKNSRKGKTNTKKQ